MAMLPDRQLVLTIVPWILAVVGPFVVPKFVSIEDPADFVTRVTARVMFAYWSIAVVLRLIQGKTRRTRLWWTLACWAFVIHVLTAFDQVHLWSHERAYTHVHETSGFGPGIFVSYSFTMLWLTDVCFWWLAERRYINRSLTQERILHGFFAFIMFNGTVVYETGWIRWLGLLVFASLSGLAWKMQRSKDQA